MGFPLSQRFAGTENAAIAEACMAYRKAPVMGLWRPDLDYRHGSALAKEL